MSYVTTLRTCKPLVLDIITRNTLSSDAAAEGVLFDYLPLLLQSMPLLPCTTANFSPYMSFSEAVSQKLAARADARFPSDLARDFWGLSYTILSLAR